MRRKSTPSNWDEFEQIKRKLIAIEAEMERLLAPPPVFATVLKVIPKLLVEDGIQKVVVIYNGELFEVEVPPGMNLKTSDNVIVDLMAKRIRRN